MASSPFLGGSSLRAFCAMGVPVTFAGVSMYPDGVPIKGNFDRASQLLLSEHGGGGVDVPRPILTLPYDAFAVMPDADDVLTVNGTNYAVDAPIAEDDGAFVSYALSLTTLPPSNPAQPAPPAGTAHDAILVTVPAGASISAFMVAAVSGGVAQIADSTSLAYLGSVTGVCPSGALAGGQVDIQTAGQLSNSGWNWQPGKPIFLGLNGQLTQTVPTVGFLQIIGTPLSSTSMLVELDDPILL